MWWDNKHPKELYKSIDKSSMGPCIEVVKNAEGSRVIIAVVQVWGVKIYVAAVEVLRKSAQEKQDETQFTTTTKIARKISLSFKLFRFVKFSFPVTHLMPYYVETGCSHPANCRTLRITLLVRSYIFGMVGFKSHEQCCRTYQTFMLCTKHHDINRMILHKTQLQATKKQQLV